MTLEDLVLGNISIADYHADYIKPLDTKRFGEGDLHTGRTVICPFHVDTDPSLGTIADKFHPGVRKYHCFGCGVSGDVIRMHQRIQKQYFGNNLTLPESARELCRLYGLDTSMIVDIDNNDDQASYMKRRLALRNISGAYTIREYQRDLLRIRGMKDLSLAEKARGINSANIKMIVTSKGLLD